MKLEGKPTYRYDWIKGAWLLTDWRWLSIRFPQRLK